MAAILKLFKRDADALDGPLAAGAGLAPVNDAHPAPPRHHKKGIRLEQDEDGGLVVVHCNGHVGGDMIRQVEDTLSRAADRCHTMQVVFHRDCDATSALIGLVMRLNTQLKRQHKPLLLKVASPRVRELLRSLRLDQVLKVE